MDTNDTTTKRKPGRPPERVLGLSEVAEVLGCPVDVLVRALEADKAALPVTWTSDRAEDVVIGERKLWRALGISPDLPRMCSIREAAEYLGKSPKTVQRWLSLRGPSGEVILPAWRHAGLIRLRVADVLAVPARLPSWASEQIAEAMACAE